MVLRSRRAGSPLGLAGRVPVTAEAGQRHADHEGTGHGDQAAAYRADDGRGERRQRTGLQVAELRAARGDHVVGGQHPAAQVLRRDGLQDRLPEHDGERVHGARHREQA